MDINKIIAQKAFEALGGKPQVSRYYNKAGTYKIDILQCDDRPDEGVSSYATIGLSDFTIGLSSGNKELRVELLGACDKGKVKFPNILAYLSFEIMTQGKCGYGQIWENFISEYYPNIDMRHLYLMSPFLWENLQTLEFEDKKVAWLLLVPISDAEAQYADENGAEMLEEQLEKADIDIFNLGRKSVI